MPLHPLPFSFLRPFHFGGGGAANSLDPLSISVTSASHQPPSQPLLGCFHHDLPTYMDPASVGEPIVCSTEDHHVAEEGPDQQDEEDACELAALIGALLEDNELDLDHDQQEKQYTSYSCCCSSRDEEAIVKSAEIEMCCSGGGGGAIGISIGEGEKYAKNSYDGEATKAGKVEVSGATKAAEEERRKRKRKRRRRAEEFKSGGGAAAMVRKQRIYISEDPQSVTARRRRQRIGERIRVLQRLVPDADNLDTASTLDKAARYLKCLQTELHLLLHQFYSPTYHQTLNHNPNHPLNTNHPLNHPPNYYHTYFPYHSNTTTTTTTTTTINHNNTTTLLLNPIIPYPYHYP